MEREQILAPGWNIADATDMLLGILSVPVCENLTIERGWSQDQYIARMQAVLRRIFVGGE